MVILNKNSDEHLRPETLMEGSHFWTEKNSFLDREGSLDKWDGNSSTRAPATHLPPDAQVNYTNEFERQIQHFFKWLETVFIQSTQCHQSVEIDEERFNLYFSQKKKLLHFLSVSRQMVRMKSGSIKSIKFHSFFLSKLSHLSFPHFQNFKFSCLLLNNILTYFR